MGGGRGTSARPSGRALPRGGTGPYPPPVTNGIPAALPAAHRPDSLWSPARRPLTLGLVLTITLVASEALAVATAMPIVARDIGGLSLYGWVFSPFFLS